MMYIQSGDLVKFVNPIAPYAPELLNKIYTVYKGGKEPKEIICASNKETGGHWFYRVEVIKQV